MRYGMVINLKRCIGCDACAMACKMGNGTPPGVLWCNVVHREIGVFPKAFVEYTPLLCMHCQNAPCVTACPTGASQKEADGIVTVMQDRCIGCRQCVVVCPYNARWYVNSKVEGYYPEVGFTAREKASYDNFEQGKVTKCNFCKERLAAGDEPACVHTCPTTSRIFGDLDDPESAVAKLIQKNAPQPLGAEYGTEPSVFYQR